MQFPFFPLHTNSFQHPPSAVIYGGSLNTPKQPFFSMSLTLSPQFPYNTSFEKVFEWENCNKIIMGILVARGPFLTLTNILT